MEIKRKPNGFEVNGVVFDTEDLAERYLESLKSGDQVVGDLNWLDESIDYTFDSDDDSNPSFKVFMEEIIQKHGLNLKQAAERIGVTRQTLYNWMNAEVIPDSASVDKICKAFGVKRLDVEMAYRDNVAKTFPDLFQILVLSPEDCRVLLDSLTKLEVSAESNNPIHSIIDKVRLIHDLAPPARKRPKRA